MPETNVELVRRSLAAFERGDVDAALDLASDDLVMYRADPEGAYFHGREGLLAALAEWTESFPDFSIEPEEYVEAGEWVLVRVRQTARGKESGAPVVGDYWFVFAVRGEAIARLEIYLDRGAAFAAAGLAG